MKKYKYSVSIILPSLNVKPYIEECIKSVINQSIKNIEIICVDAGSSDGTLDIINNYISIDNRIKLILSDKKSYGYQVNLGIDHANGEYIGIVETDDYVLDRMFETLYTIAKKYDLDFIKSDFYRFIDENNKEKLFLNKLTNDKQYYDRIINPKFNKNCFSLKMNTWSGIYKKEFLQKYNIKHNETLGASFQDTSFWFLTLCFANRIMFINEPFYMNRRDNPNSSVFDSSKIFALYDVYDYIYKKLEEYVEIKKLFMPEFQLYRYKHYMASINRSSDEQKLDFIKKISNEFKLSKNKNELDLSIFNEHSKKTLEMILNSPELYYKTYKKNQNIRKVYDYKRMYVPIKNIKKDNIKISIIIPVFNAEKTIIRCLKSIFNQTLKDIEIICIDDGSTDNSYSILKDIQDKNYNVILISHNNQGAGVSRNIGISISSGEYIAFIDSDDWYPEDDILETLYTKAKQNNVLVCGGSFSYFKDGIQYKKYKGIYENYTFTKEALIRYEDYQFDYGYTRFIYNSNMIKNNNIKFPDVKRFQDPPFFVMAMITAQKFYAIPKIVYCYDKQNNKVIWTDEKINDAVIGIIQNLKISKKYKLSKLHKITVEHLNIDFNDIIVSHLTQKNIKLYELILQATLIIAPDLLIEAGYKINANKPYILKAIKEVFFNNKINDISVIIKTNNNTHIYSNEYFRLDNIITTKKETFKVLDIIKKFFLKLYKKI